MEIEKIILELMSRIKVLEEEVSYQKEVIMNLTMSSPGSVIEEKEEPKIMIKKKNYTRTNEKMIDECYRYGKMAYNNPDADVKEFADTVMKETGMNKSSAYIYIYVVQSLLKGEQFKRHINSNALKRYFELILVEFGQEGLRKALFATQQHIEYLKQCNLPVKGFVNICDEFKVKIQCGCLIFYLHILLNVQVFLYE